MAAYGTPNVAFIGRAGSGKSTAAQFLADTFGYERLSFATPLKRIASDLWDNPGREEYQKLGEAIDRIHPGTLAELLVRDLDYIEAAANRWFSFAVDDCRREDEAAVLLSRGFVLVRLTATREQQKARLTANGKWQSDEQLDHESETQLDGYPVKYVFANNGDVTELYEFLAGVVAKELR